MTYICNFYYQARKLLDSNPKARLVGWPYGMYGNYAVFIPAVIV